MGLRALSQSIAGKECWWPLPPVSADLCEPDTLVQGVSMPTPSRHPHVGLCDPDPLVQSVRRLPDFPETQQLSCRAFDAHTVPIVDL